MVFAGRVGRRTGDRVINMRVAADGARGALLDRRTSPRLLFQHKYFRPFGSYFNGSLRIYFLLRDQMLKEV